MSTAPAACAGAERYMAGLPAKNLPCTGTPPNVTVVPRLAPTIFTSVAPPIDPTFGRMDVTNGAATVVGAISDAGIDEERQPAVPWAISKRTIRAPILITFSRATW